VRGEIKDIVSSDEESEFFCKANRSEGINSSTDTNTNSGHNQASTRAKGFLSIETIV